MDDHSMEPEPYKTIDVENVQPADVLADIILTNKGMKFLRQTRPWARFMSIIVFIGAGLMLLAGIMMFLFGASGNFLGANDPALQDLPGRSFVLGWVYLVLAVLYVAPGVFLFRYASAIKTLESACTAEALEKALKYQKSFWRYNPDILFFCP